MTISTFEETAVLSVVLGRCDLRRHCLHKSLVDHSFTTDKRGNNGDCTSQKFWKRRCSEQKRLKINGNYYKKHKKSLGKDEVGSSNLPSSSKKHRKLRFSVLFCCKNAENGVGQNVGQLPDPHRDPHNELNCTQENGHEILTHGPVRRTRI